MTMKTIFIALLFVTMMAVSACTSVPLYPAPSPQPPSYVEPPPQEPVQTMSFEEMYWNADCADIKNEFFFIQDSREYAGNSFVFWNREGNCMDNRFEQTLFSREDVLCSRSDSIAGVRENCNDEGYRQMFSTLINNLDKPNLGLGQVYTVTKMTFELDGSETPFEEISISCVQRITTNHVINTQQEYELLSANIDCLNLPPKIDFTKKTLLGKSVPGCSVAYEQQVLRNGAYEQQVLRNNEKKVYYIVYVIKKKFICIERGDVFSWRNIWILVPKIPQDYAVRFIVKQL